MITIVPVLIFVVWEIVWKLSNDYCQMKCLLLYFFTHFLFVLLVKMSQSIKLIKLKPYSIAYNDNERVRKIVNQMPLTSGITSSLAYFMVYFNFNSLMFLFAIAFVVFIFSFYFYLLSLLCFYKLPSCIFCLYFVGLSVGSLRFNFDCILFLFFNALSKKGCDLNILWDSSERFKDLLGGKSSLVWDFVEGSIVKLKTLVADFNLLSLRCYLGSGSISFDDFFVYAPIFLFEFMASFR